jgi:hypothetical protein
MKTTWKNEFELTALQRFRIMSSAVSALAVLWVASAAAQETKPATDAASPGVAEILKMTDAGVNQDVIMAYIEASASAPQPTEKDVIAMKEHKVSDEVVKLLLKRGATARTESIKAKNEAVMNVMESRRQATGGVDPESYDYFRTYYLQPRALASANQRLYPYFGPYAGRGYAFGPVFNYGAPFAGRPVYRGPH